MQNRRKLIRFKATFILKFSAYETACEFQGVVKDISMGGVRVVVDKSLEPLVNCMVSFYLLLPRQTFKIDGEIAWAKEYEDRKEIGIQFVHIPDSYKEEIYDYISKYYRKELTQKWWQRHS